MDAVAELRRRFPLQVGLSSWPRQHRLPERSCRIQHLGAVISNVADLLVGRLHLHRIAFVGGQEIDGWLTVPEAIGRTRCAGKLAIVITRVQNDGHAIVDRRHELVRLDSDDAVDRFPPAGVSGTFITFVLSNNKISA